ncbi:MAG: hypothetical protein PVG22_10390, partial [Chromatiales bacterium]
LCLPFVNLIWVMLLKFVTGGHPREYHIAPGIYPKWSRMHLRLWFVGRLQTLVLSPTRVLFRSAPVTRFVLRGLGARIGSNLQAASDVNFFGPLELLSIGHDVTIQSAALVSTAQWAGQLLQIGPVRLEDECKIGMRAAVSPDVKVGRGTWVTPFTPMLNTTGPGEMWDGAPARCTGGYHRLRRLSESLGEVRHPWLMETLNLSLQAAFESLLVVIPVGAVAWFVHALTPLTGVTAFSGPVTTHAIAALCVEIGLYGIVTTWLSIFLVSLLTCLFLRLTRSAPGIYASRGLRGLLLLYRVKKMNQVQRIWGWSIIGQYLRALSGMRFTHIGASECDVMHNLVPESVGASSNVFWSHGCMTNLLDHDADYLKLGQIEMPVDFFAGNGSVTDAGQYPSHFLLGVVTPGDDIRFRRQMRTRFTAPMAVAGNPPLKFAVPVAGDTSDSADLPSLGLFLLRFCLFDLIKVGVLPTAEIICYALVFLVLHLLGFGVVAAAALALVGTELWLLLLCLMTKRVLVGRWGEDATTSFWSVQHFSYFFSQDCFFGWCSNSLSLFAGTLLPNLFLRRMGCRIGRRTIITSPLQAFDWNAIDLGDDCVADGLFQLHTFEGMMLKVKRARIGNGCCLSQGTCVMGGASIESGSSLLPLSLVLKDMQLRTACYEGSPVGAIHG